MTRYDYGIGKIDYVKVNPNPVRSNGTTTITVKISNIGSGWSYFNVGVYVSGQSARFGDTRGVYPNKSTTYTFNISGINNVKSVDVICWMYNFDKKSWLNHDEWRGILYPHTTEKPPENKGFDPIKWIWDHMKPILTGFIKSWQWLTDFISSIASNIAHNVFQGIDWLELHIKDWVTGIVKSIFKGIDWIKMQLYDWVTGIVRSIFKGIDWIKQQLYNWVKGIASSVANSVKWTLSKIEQVISNWFNSILSDIIGAITTGFNEAIKNINKIIKLNGDGKK